MAQQAARKKIALMPGDGIGHEVMAAADAVLQALHEIEPLPLDWETLSWPSTAWHQQHGEMMPEDALQQVQRYDALLLGALGDPGPSSDAQRYLLPDSISLAPLLTFRKGLQLWACERPARLLPGAPQYLADPRAADVDMLVWFVTLFGVRNSDSLLGQKAVTRFSAPKRAVLVHRSA